MLKAQMRRFSALSEIYKLDWGRSSGVSTVQLTFLSTLYHVSEDLFFTLNGYIFMGEDLFAFKRS